MGGFYLWTLLFLISLIGYHEFCKAVRPMKVPSEEGISQSGGESGASSKVLVDLPELVGLFCAASYEAVLWFFPQPEKLFLVLIISLILFMALYVFTFPKYSCSQIIEFYFGLIYVVAMLGFLHLIRIRPDGLIEIILVFAGSWVCDTFAYLSGRALGRHKLAPVLSPKKSIEGSVGGVLGSILAGVLLAYLAGKNLMVYGIAAGVGGLISQIGDLFASGIKRNKGIKDYGNLIPGHGGILDRFDSVIIIAPVIYFCCAYLL